MPGKTCDVYRCETCGKVVEVLQDGGGTLVCCKNPMVKLAENSTDAAQEKHVPVVQAVEGGYKVTVGSVAHPMQAEHYITWIELVADGQVLRAFLNPGDLPEATFCVSAGEVTARAYCNLHGLWRG